MHFILTWFQSALSFLLYSGGQSSAQREIFFPSHMTQHETLNSLLPVYMVIWCHTIL